MLTGRGLLHRLALVAALILFGGVVVYAALDRGLLRRWPDGGAVVIIGIAGALWLGGLRWLHRVVTLDEGEPTPWRYRDRHTALRPGEPTWWQRAIATIDGMSPRFTMRVLLLAAVGLIGVALVGMLSPGVVGPTSAPTSNSWVRPAGIVGMLVGMAWMLRIYRRPLEADPPAWRYRDQRDS